MNKVTEVGLGERSRFVWVGFEEGDRIVFKSFSTLKRIFIDPFDSF